MAIIPIRPIEFFGDIAVIPLSNGRFAIIDAADAPLVEGRNWHAARSRNTFYARTNDLRREGRGRGSLRLHRVILGAADGTEVDHIDGNGLNNRRCNLRSTTTGENQRNAKLRKDNRTGLKGVSRRGDRWVARITHEKQLIYLGTYDEALAAYAAYCTAAENLHGEFARFK